MIALIEIYVNKSQQIDEENKSDIFFTLQLCTLRVLKPIRWHTPMDGPLVNHRALYLSIWGFDTLRKGTSAAVSWHLCCYQQTFPPFVLNQAPSASQLSPLQTKQPPPPTSIS